MSCQLPASQVYDPVSTPNGARCNAWSWAESIWGRVPDVDEAVAKIDAVSTADVRRYAGELCAAPAALALYGPVSDAPGLEAIRKGLAA